MKDAKPPSGGARVSGIPIRKHGSTGETESSEDAVRPKSVFQIGGAGAVGTGSVRGMPHLLTLAKNGFGIWPFSEGWPRVVEIYPRALTGPVNKGRWSARHDYLVEHFPEQPKDLLERAAGSEDAFDAAVSALVMSEHEAELRALGPLADPPYGIEGKIWRPEPLNDDPGCAASRERSAKRDRGSSVARRCRKTSELSHLSDL